jgi:Zn-finger nucleic acid-binding protein
MEAQVKQGMLCPVCRTDLMMTDRQGVEIDYCPRCRGVWLDRGELDKIIDRSAADTSQVAAAPAHRAPEHAPGYERGDERHRYRDHDDDRRYYGDRRHYRRKSWLGEMFDFD